MRKKYEFGKWKILMEESIEYGGRTLKQFANFSIRISMTRYLREKSNKDGERTWERPNYPRDTNGDYSDAKRCGEVKLGFT